MKKLFCMLLLLMLLCPAVLAEDLTHVADQAGAFSDAQIAQMEQAMDEIYDTYGVDMVVVTTNDSLGKEASLYAADFYDDFRDYDAYPDGALLAYCFDISQYYEVSRGKARAVFADRGRDELSDVLSPYLPSKNYADASMAWIRHAQEILRPKSPFEIAGKYLIFAIILAVIIAFVVVFLMKAKMKTAKFASGANDYIQNDTLDVTYANDIFLYETVTRVKIEKPSSSGGSDSVTSSSGNSYGGRGGSL